MRKVKNNLLIVFILFSMGSFLYGQTYSIDELNFESEKLSISGSIWKKESVSS